MIYIHWIILTIYCLIVLIAIINLLTDNRQPAKTIAWLLILICVPVAGLVLYFFFGQNAWKEHKITRMSKNGEEDGNGNNSEADSDTDNPDTHLSVSPNHAMIIRLYEGMDIETLYEGNKIDILTSGYDFFMSLLYEIGHAKRHIHLLSYIIAEDPLGNLISDALADSVKRGVKVRVLYDDVGSWKTKDRFFRRMTNRGIEVRPFLPVRFPPLTSKLNYRNHRKVIVIDGSLGYIGGMNIALRYIKGDNKGLWTDTHLKITGSGVHGLQHIFLKDWFYMSRTHLDGNTYYPSIDNSASGSLMQVITSSPMRTSQDIMQGYVRVLLGARRYVYMVTPYFLPTDIIEYAMRTAAQSGVDVRLILPEKGDSRMVSWASKSFLMAAEREGIMVNLYNKGFIHSKFLVADDNFVSCGSANLDFRSLENNFEATAFIYDETTALNMKSLFMKLEEDCTTMKKNRILQRSSFLQHLWESMLRLLAPLL